MQKSVGVYLMLATLGVLSSCADERKPLLLSKSNLMFRDTLCKVLQFGDYDKVREVGRVMPDAQNGALYTEGIIALDSIRNRHRDMYGEYLTKAQAAVIPYYEQKIQHIFGDHDAITLALGGGSTIQLNKSKVTEEFNRYKDSQFVHRYFISNPQEYHAFLDAFPYGINAIIEQYGLRALTANDQMSTLLAILGKIRYEHDRVGSDYIDSARVLMDSYTRIKGVEFGFDEGTNQYTIPPSLILLDMYGDCDKKTLVSYGVLRSLGRHVANIVTYRHNFMAFSNKQYLSRGKGGFSRNGLHYLPLETTRSEVTPGNKVILFDEILSIFDCNGAIYKKPLGEQYIGEQKSCVCDHL